MPAFLRPYITEYLESRGISAATQPARAFAYTDNFLKSGPIFPLLVLDGGAFFLTRELLGEFDGNRLLAALESGELFAHWSNNGQFDWDHAWTMSQREHSTANLEQHVFINRLYFLLPVAQRFMQTGNERFAALWLRFFDDWHARHPYQPLDARPRHQTDYVWRDMQVAWRLEIMLLSVKMLAGSTLVESDAWFRVYDSLRLHAEHLAQEGQSDLDNRFAQNHVLQKGMVLLWMGVLFPELPQSGHYEVLGRSLLEMNLTGAVYADGGSNEGSPSYSHFIARLYLEGWLILAKNRLTPIPGLEAGITKQYAWLRDMSAPDGQTLQIGDSYALETVRDLEIVNELFPLDLQRRTGSLVFPDSRWALLRGGRFEVYIDASDRIMEHQHFGRPNVLVYIDGQPLFVDSGCPNYDLRVFHDFLMAEHSHNAVNIGTRANFTIETTQIDLDSPRITFKMTSGQYIWTRCVAIENSDIVVSDKIVTDEPQDVRLTWHLAALKVRMTGQDAVVSLIADEVVISINGGDINPVEYRPYQNQMNETAYSPVLVSYARGTVIIFETRVHVAE